jgi:hypothetical protein
MTLAGQGSRLMAANLDSAQQPLRYTGTEFILCMDVHILNGRGAVNIDFVGLPVVKASKIHFWLVTLGHRYPCRRPTGIENEPKNKN